MNAASTFIAYITIHYNINYTLTISASNCAGSGRQHINFLTGIFYVTVAIKLNVFKYVRPV